MKKAFEIVFDRINKVRLESDICTDFWSKLLRLKENFNEDYCWSLLFDNIQWLIAKKILNSSDLLDWFSEEDLNDHDIFFKGNHIVKNGKAIGFCNAFIEASGHSKIILFETARCEAFDTSFVTCFGNSEVVARDCIVNSFDDSQVTIKGFGLVEAWDKSQIIAENRSVVVKRDNSVASGGIDTTII